MRGMRGVLLGILVGMCSGPLAAQAATPLDGTKWKIAITPDEAARKAGEKASKDNLVFKNGQVTSAACVKYGFAPSSYTAAGAPTSPSFQMEQVSPKEGKMSWSGQVSGDTIAGTTTWTKTNGKTLHYQFSGKKAKSS